MSQYPAILSSLYNTPHVVHPDKLREIAGFVEARQRGLIVAHDRPKEPEPYCVSVGSGEMCSMEAAATQAGNGFVAVLPLFGTMFQHGSLEMDASGGTSTEKFGKQFSALVSNQAVKSIVLEVHSPGGQVYGTSELSDLIFAAREQKRVIASVNSMAASGALWASTAAKKVFVTPGGEMGSIGVVVMHEDVSAAEEKAGVKTTLIATPEAKIDGHPFGPLSETAEATLKSRIGDMYSRFTKAVARNRGVSTGTVQSDFGRGGMLLAKDAVSAGLADGVATFRDVLAHEVDRLRSIAGRGNSRANSRALQLAEAESDLTFGTV